MGAARGSDGHAHKAWVITPEQRRWVKNLRAVTLIIRRTGRIPDQTVRTSTFVVKSCLMGVSRRVRVQDRTTVVQSAAHTYPRAASWNRNGLAERPGGVRDDGGN